MDFSDLVPARTVRLATAYAVIVGIASLGFAALGEWRVVAGGIGVAAVLALLAWRYQRVRRERQRLVLHAAAVAINAFALVAITDPNAHGDSWLMPLILFNHLVASRGMGATLSVASVAIVVVVDGYLDEPARLISTVGAALLIATGLLIFGRGLRARLRTLNRRVRRDALTGLLNRRAFDEDLAEAVMDADAFAVALLDLDRFKPLNDRHGHQAGDRALQHFGRLLGRHLRGRDRAYRYGGEEFALLLPECAPGDALQVTERIRRAVEAASLGPDRDTTVSAGTAAWRPGESAVALIKRADSALYAAKTSGRNRCLNADT